MKTVYGPVPSWRLGRSLGVDPICARQKTCPFDCIYCQLGRTKKKTLRRRRYIDIGAMRSELRAVPKGGIDTITFSGTGEPTLNSQLGEMISFAKGLGIPVAVLTNSSLLRNRDVRKALMEADIVAAKLDAPNEQVFREINRPCRGLRFSSVLSGIRDFRRRFTGKFALQMMFVDGNRQWAEDMARLARGLGPDEVQLDTPLRRSPVPPLSPREMAAIEVHFRGLPFIQVYTSRRPKVLPMDLHEMRLRRPG
jgi:wyosine [tRNA(Phe)-imidazoG37] synthetase (radical SAM superfamily)